MFRDQIGLYSGPTSGLASFAQWHTNGRDGIDLHTLLCVAIQVAELYTRFRITFPTLSPDFGDALQRPGANVSALLREIGAMQELSTVGAQRLASQVRALEPILSTVDAATLAATKTDVAQQLLTLVSFAEACMIAVTDMCAELSKTLVRVDEAKTEADDEAAALCLRCAQVIILAFIAAGAERLKDALGIVHGRKERINLPESLKKARAKDMLLPAQDLEFLVIVGIDSLGDALSLLGMLPAVSRAVKKVHAHKWTAPQWLLFSLGLQEQYRLRRRALVHSGNDEDQGVVATLGAREIFVRCEDLGDDGQPTFVDAALYLCAILGLKSRSVIFLQLLGKKVTDAEAGQRKVGDLRLKDIPHFTVGSASDLVLLVGKSDKMIEMYERLRQRFNVTTHDIDDAVKATTMDAKSDEAKGKQTKEVLEPLLIRRFSGNDDEQVQGAQAHNKSAPARFKWLGLAAGAATFVYAAYKIWTRRTSTPSVSGKGSS